MNISLSSRHSVHAAHDNSNTPKCTVYGGNGAESYRSTTREVTCKKCLKIEADELKSEAAYQDRLADSMAPSSDFHATVEAADQDAEIVEIRETAEFEANELRAASDILRDKAAGTADETETADPFEADAPIVAELNGRPAVWMVMHQGRQMWQCRNAPGRYTRKNKALAAQSRYESATVLQWKQANPGRSVTR